MRNNVAHLSRSGSRVVMLNPVIECIKSKYIHMDFIFSANKKHSPGSFAKKVIIKKVSLVISCFLYIIKHISKNQEITKETFL